MSAPRVGVIGGGQLARMLQPAAVNLGVELSVLANSHSESAAQVIPKVSIGSHHDWQSVAEFARNCDVVTFDHEHVPLDFLEKLQQSGVAIQPGPHALVFAQDKLEMRKKLSKIGIPCPIWSEIKSDSELKTFGEKVSYPFILKTATGGYDGKGVWVVENYEDARKVFFEMCSLDSKVLAEQLIRFTRELSAQVARSVHGQSVAYPIVQSTQTNGICHEVISPCPEFSNDRSAIAQQIALTIAKELDVVGMLAVELFDTGSELLVNELAMRPHNSGHWTMDGAVTSQFENHLRAILDWPLGSPATVSPATVMVNLLGKDVGNLHSAFRHVMARDPGIKIHLYGKEVTPGRKIGHVNVSGENVEDLLERAWHAANYLTGVINE